MNIDKETVKMIVKGTKERGNGIGLNETEVEELAANFDDQGVREYHETRLQAKKWDRETPINGVPAEQVLQGRDDIPEDGVVYIICDGDQVIYFQPFEPDAEGYNVMSDDNWEEVATKHKKNIVEDSVRSAFSNEIVNALNTKHRER